MHRKVRDPNRLMAFAAASGSPCNPAGQPNHTEVELAVKHTPVHRSTPVISTYSSRATASHRGGAATPVHRNTAHRHHTALPHSMTWIFGYGSLVHTPGFAYKQRVNGYIRGYRRVWWQGSTDHRGTPEFPGRTVTLVEEPGAVTWGVAYQLAGTEEEQAATVAYLEWREKQYDVRAVCDMFIVDASGQQQQDRGSATGAAGSSTDGTDSGGEQQADNSSTSTSYIRQQQQQPPHDGVLPGCLVYIATCSAANANWLGPAPLEEVATRIAAAHGPSGPNSEYLFRLADAMRQMHVHDAELCELERLVKLAQHGSGRQPQHAAPAGAAAAAAESSRAAEAAQGGKPAAAGAPHAIQLTAVAAAGGGAQPPPA